MLQLRRGNIYGVVGLRIDAFALKLCSEIQETWSFRLPLSPAVQKPGVGIFFWSSWGLKQTKERAAAYRHHPSPHDQHSIAQFDQEKNRPGFLHSRAPRESKGSSPLNDCAWIHTSGHAHLHTSLIYARMYTSLTICKTPHLAQPDQARWTRFFLRRQTPLHPQGSQSVVWGMWQRAKHA